MNYKLIYDRIIERARARKLEGYKEKHHIIPKSLGGLNSKDNLVELTAKEHFICHKLLVKIYPDNAKLKFALLAMCNLKNKVHKRSYIITANEYEYVRKLVSEAKKGKNTRTNKYIPSDETRKKLSEANLGRIPWNKGLLGYRKGIAKSDEHKLKISNAVTGYRHSAESKQKMSESRKGVIRDKKECPHCHRFLDPGNYAQFHGDKCKFNLINQKI